MSSLTVFRGLPGSGKSTSAWGYQAARPGVVRVNRDDIRRSNFGDEGILPWQDEQLVTKFEQDMAAVALKAGRDVIVDDMNLRLRYVREWNEFALRHGATFGTRVFDTPVDVCVVRDSARKRTVGEDVIRSLAAKYLDKDGFIRDYDKIQQEPEKPYANPSHLPHMVLCDIDGTMALMGNRNPYDELTVSHDLPNWPVVKLVQSVIASGDRVVFMSGRSEDCRDDTANWLNRYIPRNWANWLLLMRKSGDNRKDYIVKREIFDAEIRDKFHVKFVLDDRPSVCRMWRSLGLPVFQVADPDIEF